MERNGFLGRKRNLRTKDILEKELFDLNQKNCKSLREYVKKKKVTWILGAGVSAPAGLPDWKRMLAGMWTRVTQLEWRGDDLSGGADKIFVNARKNILQTEDDLDLYYKRANDASSEDSVGIFDDINVLESAEYMWNYVKSFFHADQKGNQEALAEAVLDSLIKKVLCIKQSQEELRETLKKQALGRLAALLGEQKGSVITYNYDNLLEFCLEKIEGVRADDIKIYCDRNNDFCSSPEKINIYHPHGRLNVVETAEGSESEFTVLTESSYYDLEQQIYNWQNSIQAKAPMDTSCVFIGFSGDDYNFRRIIKNTGIQNKYGKKDRESGGNHFIFICLDKAVEKFYKKAAEDYRAEKGTGCPLWDEEMFRFIKTKREYVYDRIQLVERLHAQFAYWEKRGITAVWTTYEELPLCLEGFLDKIMD